MKHRPGGGQKPKAKSHRPGAGQRRRPGAGALAPLQPGPEVLAAPEHAEQRPDGLRYRLERLIVRQL